jgi:hypothetical protein
MLKQNLLFLAIWLFLLLAGRSAMLRDPGSFWHLAAGQKMLAEGHVPHTDSFSFTMAGRPWVDDQWLAECGMAAIYRLAGWDGLLLSAATLLAAIYTWLTWRLLRSGLGWLPAGVLLSLLLLIGSPQFHVRPLVVTLGLVGVTFAWLVDVEAGKTSSRRLWWLVPLAALWANLHGGVLGGLGTVACCVGGWCLTRVFRRERLLPPSTIPPPVRGLASAVELLALLAAMAAATLLNPYGLELPREWLQTLAMPLPAIIDEHRPLDWTAPAAWAMFVLMAVYLIALAGVFPRRPRLTWLMPLVWFVLALGRVRNAPLAAVVTAIALADMLPSSRLGQRLAASNLFAAPRPAVGWRSAGLPLLAVLAAVALQTGGIGLPVIGHGWARFDPARWPMRLVPRLQEIERTGTAVPGIFNDLNFGGFVIYHAPGLPVFIDDRCALFGAAFLVAYDRARREDPAQLDRWQRQYGFRYALVETGGQFDRYLAAAGGWAMVARTPPAALYRRDMGVSAAGR